MKFNRLMNSLREKVAPMKLKRTSRTANAIFNFLTSMGSEVVSLVVKFIVRTVFINTLGTSYLGIGSLFNNILSMLSLVELGVGSAILYKLYDPVAHEDHHRITVLMKFYKRAYQVIGVAVAVIGCCLIPFLPLLIKNYDKLESLGLNAVVIFLIYLFRTVSSYLFFAYRSAIIRVNQKTYIITIIGYIFTILTGVLQIISLLIYPNFIFYLSISFIDTIIKNICCAVISDRMYPYIKDTTKDRLSREEVKCIFKDCSALLLYKMNGVVAKATDNIVLSAFIGLDMVALYSNYYVFYTSIKSFVNKTFNSLSHGLGNLHVVSADRDDTFNHEYDVFEVVMFIATILGATSFVGISCCANEFVSIWIGSDWIIAQPFATIMGLELYTHAIKAGLSRYRQTMGLFQQGKYRPLAGMVINLIVSIALVNVWGICGVLVGTVASDWLTYMWYDPLLIHSQGFNNRALLWRYYGKFVKNFIISCFIGTIDWLICSHLLIGYSWFSLAVHILVCAITVPSVLFIFYRNKTEGKYVIKQLSKFFRRYKKSSHVCA